MIWILITAIALLLLLIPGFIVCMIAGKASSRSLKEQSDQEQLNFIKQYQKRKK